RVIFRLDSNHVRTVEDFVWSRLNEKTDRFNALAVDRWNWRYRVQAHLDRLGYDLRRRQGARFLRYVHQNPVRNIAALQRHMVRMEMSDKDPLRPVIEIIFLADVEQ